MLHGCAGRPAEPMQLGAKAAPPLDTTTSSAGPPTRTPEAGPQPAIDPTLLITDRAVLSALEARGLSLAAVMGNQAARDNQQLSELVRFAPLLRELEAELARAGAADKLAGVDVARFSHRLFDRRFLRLPQAGFELAGVVNRPDRANFHARSCGETRLIYRLGYTLDAERASKLPMTLAIELDVSRDAPTCRAAAARWLEPPANTAEVRADWLRSERGPLAPALTALTRERARVVVNLQLVRWPSTVRPDLGGHAEYLLRSFRLDESGWLAPERLENTIEPGALVPSSRRELLAWLDREREGVERGDALLPDPLLATRAISVTPRGLHRFANRPFSSALASETFPQRDFSGSRLIKSRAGLLRRLDELSCPGCHQARSVAGFHLLGEDASDAPAENALAVAVSPQVIADLPRRLLSAKRLLNDAEALVDAPFAEHSAQTGGYGEACGLGADATFAGWTCGAGLRCSAIEAGPDDDVGQCLPVVPEVGDACETGNITREGNRLRDRVQKLGVESCGRMICNRSSVGFPAGMCTANCGAPAATCGAIAILDPFNACLARGDSFLSCVRGNVREAGLRACDDHHPCRDDYVCTRTERGGACLPPYFVFQLRVDGHSSGLH